MNAFDHFNRNHLIDIKLKDGNLKDALLFFKAVTNQNIFYLCRESLTELMKIGEEYFLCPWSYDSGKDIFITHYDKRIPTLHLTGRPSIDVLEEVNKILFFQLDITFYYLKIKSEQKALTKSKKDYFRNKVIELENCCISIKNNVEYKKYQSETIRPFLLILTSIFEDYKMYAPKISDGINEIFLENPDFKNKYVKRNLKIEVIEEIFKLNDKYSDNFFRICNDKTKKNNIRKAFKYFLYGQFEKIDTPIEFHWKSEVSYYLIFKLCQYLGYTESQVADKKHTLFTICGSSYSAISAYSAKRRIAKRKNGFKIIIDSLIESNLH